MTTNVDTCTKLLRTRVQFPAPPPLIKESKMNIEDVKKGMRVRISQGSCKKTNETCGMTAGMLVLRGHTGIVNHVLPRLNIVKIEGWDWDPADIRNISKIKKKEQREEFFDAKKVWVC